MVRGAVVVLLIAASTFCSTSALSANPLPTKVCAVGGYDKWTIGGYKLVRQERQKVLDALVAQVTKKLKPSNLGTNKPFKVSELQPFGKDCSLNDGYCTKIIDGCSKVSFVFSDVVILSMGVPLWTLEKHQFCIF